MDKITLEVSRELAMAFDNAPYEVRVRAATGAMDALRAVLGTKTENQREPEEVTERRQIRRGMSECRGRNMLQEFEDRHLRMLPEKVVDTNPDE